MSEPRDLGPGGEPQPDPADTAPAEQPTVAVPQPRQVTPPLPRGIRVRTVVFGLVLLAVSVTVLVATLSAVHVDVAAVALAVLIAAGAALVAGGVAAAAREARGGPGT